MVKKIITHPVPS